MTGSDTDGLEIVSLAEAKFADRGDREALGVI